MYLWILFYMSFLLPGTPQIASIFMMKEGILVVEAEHFHRQEANDVRTWVLHHQESETDLNLDDPDEVHLIDASGGAYVEVLSDTRTTHDDPLIHGENFSNEPGRMAILHYDVWIDKPARYYVWVRAYSTGSEDNGIHVGLDGTWPESGRRMQWCEGKHQWTWASKQRTKEEHCGVPGRIFLDIKEPGRHTISFSMREDGFEFDKWILTSIFQSPEGHGPEESALSNE